MAYATVKTLKKITIKAVLCTFMISNQISMATQEVHGVSRVNQKVIMNGVIEYEHHSVEYFTEKEPAQVVVGTQDSKDDPRNTTRALITPQQNHLEKVNLFDEGTFFQRAGNNTVNFIAEEASQTIHPIRTELVEQSVIQINRDSEKNQTRHPLAKQQMQQAILTVLEKPANPAQIHCEPKQPDSFVLVPLKAPIASINQPAQSTSNWQSTIIGGTIAGIVCFIAWAAHEEEKLAAEAKNKL